jgi:hypothetical protein
VSDPAIVRLEHRSPVAAVALLSHVLGVPLDRPDVPGTESRTLTLGGARLELREIPTGARDGRLQVIAVGRIGAGSGGDEAAVAAVGIATVDTDRFASERGWSLVQAESDRQLGAVVHRVRGAPMAGLTVLLLEPDTEGRTAASLARLGEGPVVLYVRPTGGSAAAAARAVDLGVRISAVRPGPFGNERLLLNGPPWGPHVLLVDSGTVCAAGQHHTSGAGAGG